MCTPKLALRFSFVNHLLPEHATCSPPCRLRTDFGPHASKPQRSTQSVHRLLARRRLQPPFRRRGRRRRAQVGSKVQEPFVGVCKVFCGNLLPEKKNLSANLSVRMDSSYAYESIRTLKFALRFFVSCSRLPQKHEKSNSEQGIEQHFGAVSQRTPHNSRRHTAPHRVYIDALPDVRAGSSPPSVDEAAGEGRR